MSFPGLYPDENKIIPYSKNKRFGFASPTPKTIELETMKDMTIDQIVELYKDGYTIEDTYQKIVNVQGGGIFISSGAILLIGIGLLAYLYLRR